MKADFGRFHHQTVTLWMVHLKNKPHLGWMLPLALHCNHTNYHEFVCASSKRLAKCRVYMLECLRTLYERNSQMMEWR